MDFSGPLGAYPPPNSFTWKHGVFDATRPLNVALGPGIGAWTTECISDALASVGAKPSVSREETPTHLSWLSLTDSAGKHAAPPDLEFKGIGSESYELNVSSDGITLVARSPRGLSYGVDTLVRMVRDTGGRLPAVSVADGPSCEVRGVHLFLPGRSDLEFFIRLMEFLARHRYNTIFLETAAGMEFERHPEINRAWDVFARELMDHACAQKGLQESQWFDWKNDPHVELGGGSWLTKDETRRIADAARTYDIEIIPEVQSLAHAYYLTTAHPEIAEAQDDPWPDSYCPSNPRSYELLFDVMGEVIEVFEPRTIHIGHDEAYTFRRCGKCRKKTAAKLFAGDVTRIYDWLAAKDVRTAMWADKLLDIRHPTGETYGGVLRRVFKGKKQWVMPPTHKAVHDIPRDIMMLDWYWMLDDRTPEKLGDLGFEEIIYGNFPGGGMDDWRARRAEFPNIKGAEISTWIGPSEDVLSRSGHSCIHQFVEGASTLWCDEYDPRTERGPLQTAAQKRITHERDTLGARTSLFTRARTAPERFAPLKFDGAEPFAPGGGRLTNVEPGSQSLNGLPLMLWSAERGIGCARVSFLSPISRIPVNAKAKALLALFGTSIDHRARTRNDELYLGKEVVGRLRFHYGAEDSPDRDVAIMDLVFGETLQPWNKPARSYWSEPALEAEMVDGERVVLYAVEWENPHPERDIRQIDLVWMGGRTMEGEICLFGLSSER